MESHHDRPLFHTEMQSLSGGELDVYCNGSHRRVGISGYREGLLIKPEATMPNYHQSQH